MISRIVAAVRKDWHESDSDDKSFAVVAGVMILCGLSFLGHMMYTTKFVDGPRTVFSQERRTYEVVGIKRPKHFRLDLRDVVTGRVYENVSVSTHCNAWEKLKMNSRWDMTTTVYVYEISRRFTIDINAKGVCDALR